METLCAFVRKADSEIGIDLCFSNTVLGANRKTRNYHQLDVEERLKEKKRQKRGGEI